MFRIIDFNTIIRLLVFGTTIVSILIYITWQKYTNATLSLFEIFKIVPWASLAVVLMLTTTVTARPIWKLVKFFKKDTFPDLNGMWEGEIIVSETMTIPARARIYQSLLRMQIDLHTETSKSVTLETTPTFEFDQFKVYYHYRAIPKNPGWDEYRGFTTFDIRTITIGTQEFLELSGAYFTTRRTIGRVRLRQCSRGVSGDVSYY